MYAFWCCNRSSKAIPCSLTECGKRPSRVRVCATRIIWFRSGCPHPGARWPKPSCREAIPRKRSAQQLKRASGERLPHPGITSLCCGERSDNELAALGIVQFRGVPAELRHFEDVPGREEVCSHRGELSEGTRRKKRCVSVRKSKCVEAR